MRRDADRGGEVTRARALRLLAAQVEALAERLEPQPPSTPELVWRRLECGHVWAIELEVPQTCVFCEAAREDKTLHWLAEHSG